MKAAKRVVSLVAVLVLVMSLVACGGDKIVGSWEYSQEGLAVTFTFEKDGKLNVNMGGFAMSGTYSTDGDKLTMTLSMFGQEESTVSTYTIEGDKLTITDEDGTKQVLTKK